MGKTVAYVAAAVVFMGIGALVAGLSVWFTHRETVKAALSSESRYAQCVLQGTGSPAVTGTISLKQRSPKSFVHLTGEIRGLTQGLHGFHVHQWGVRGVEAGCKDAAGHYNPHGYNHSSPNSTERHVGDLGNVEAFQEPQSAQGAGNNPVNTLTTIDIKDSFLSLWGQYSIVGRSIVVHAGEDDLGLGGNDGSIKTGNAGGRVACCNIYVTPDPTQ